MVEGGLQAADGPSCGGEAEGASESTLCRISNLLCLGVTVFGLCRFYVLAFFSALLDGRSQMGHGGSGCALSCWAQEDE